MPGNRETIKEFLISLGFQTDGDSWRRFQDHVREATHVAAGLAATLTGAGVAAVAMANETAKSLQQLHFQSQRAGSTVRNLQAIGFAAQTLGMSGEGMQGLVENLRLMMRAQPGLAGVLEGFGINPGADTTKVLDQLLARLRTMPRYLALQYGQLFGIDQRQLATLLNNYRQFIDAQKQGREIQRQMGINADAAAKASNRYEQALTGVEARVYTLREALAIALLPAMTEATHVVNGLLVQFAKWVKANKTVINEKVIEYVKGFRIALQKIPWGEIVKGAQQFGHGMEWLAAHSGGWGNLIAVALALMTARIIGLSGALTTLFALLSPKRLAILGVVGAAIAGYRAFKYYERKGHGDALAGFKQEIERVEKQFAAAGGNEQAVTGAGALPLGLRSNNPGNLQPGGKEMTFPTMTAGLVAMGRLLVKYAAHGTNTIRKIISKYAPPGSNPTASYVRNVSAALGISPDKQLDLANHPQLLARLMGVMVRFEQGQQPFGARALLAAAKAAEGARVVNNVSPNVRITINGSSDPKAMANEIGKTQQRVNANLLHDLRGAVR